MARLAALLVGLCVLLNLASGAILVCPSTSRIVVASADAGVTEDSCGDFTPRLCEDRASAVECVLGGTVAYNDSVHLCTLGNDTCAKLPHAETDLSHEWFTACAAHTHKGPYACQYEGANCQWDVVHQSCVAAAPELCPWLYLSPYSPSHGNSTACETTHGCYFDAERDACFGMTGLHTMCETEARALSELYGSEQAACESDSILAHQCLWSSSDKLCVPHFPMLSALYAQCQSVEFFLGSGHAAECMFMDDICTPTSSGGCVLKSELGGCYAGSVSLEACQNMPQELQCVTDAHGLCVHAQEAEAKDASYLAVVLFMVVTGGVALTLGAVDIGLALSHYRGCCATEKLEPEPEPDPTEEDLEMDETDKPRARKSTHRLRKHRHSHRYNTRFSSSAATATTDSVPMQPGM